MTPTDFTSGSVSIVRPKTGWEALNLRALWQFRELTLALASRDVMLRYRQTALGVAWVVIQPLLGATIFSLIFGIIAKLPSPGVPYFVVSFSGLLGWTLFNGSLTRIASSFVSNRQLITKVSFPRLVLPLSNIASTLIDFTVGLALMAVLLIIFRIPVGLNLLFLPVSVLIMLVLALGVGIAAASLAVYYRDVLFILPTITQLWFYASPVGYSAAAVPEHLKTLYFLNPMAAPVEVFRWSLLGNGQPHLLYLAYSAVVAAIVLFLGCFVFSRMDKAFADVI